MNQKYSLRSINWEKITTKFLRNYVLLHSLYKKLGLSFRKGIVEFYKHYHLTSYVKCTKFTKYYRFYRSNEELGSIQVLSNNSAEKLGDGTMALVKTPPYH